MALHVAHAALREAPPLRQVVHGPITFVAHCDRDGMPFFGNAYVGYVPTGGRIGPTTLRRMVKRAARHGELALDAQLAAMLQVCLRPAGIAIVLRTAHDCAAPRLIVDEGGGRRSAAWHGRYRADRRLRAEFLARCTASERPSGHVAPF